MKQIILDTVEDLISKFLYYDRKEDEELPRGAIERAIANGQVSVDDIVEKIRQELTKNI